MKNVNLKLLLVVGLLLIALYKLYPTYRFHTATPEQRAVLEEKNPDEYKGAIKLGLDLQGGIRLVLELDKSKLSEKEAKDATDRALGVIRNRVDQFGVSEPVIQKQGDERIIVEMPGFSDISRAKKLVGSTAQLEFKLVREAEDLGPAIDAIDRFVKKGVVADSASGDSSKVAAAGDSATAKKDTASSAKDLFGATAAPVDSTAKDSALSDEEKEAERIQKEMENEKPFTSLLVKAGYDIAVPRKNIDRVKRMIAEASAAGVISPALEFAWQSEMEGEKGDEFRRLYLLKSKAELTGSFLKDAKPSVDQSGMSAGGSVVNMTLDKEGGKRFSKVTGANVDKRLAIVLDGQVFSAPVIKGKISGGSAEISGMANYEEARDLSVILRAGALPAPLNIIEERIVGPSLGRDSVEQGTKATILGFSLVCLFMLVLYRKTGTLAIVALLLNVIFLLSVLAGMGLTLTLPGIAGIILTIGIAVDANVIINERIKEELATGKTVKASITTGYSRAFTAIFDANLTSIITAIILQYYGTGPLKGFAITLIIGLVSSMFTAIWVTRQIFNRMMLKGEMSKLSI
ncbi:MAG: protein translocase subunit SecD [Fibrobacteres bacterium]|nr:protein translocase subunit SecD [Fibrobacterota bacterium]